VRVLVLLQACGWYLGAHEKSQTSGLVLYIALFVKFSIHCHVFYSQHSLVYTTRVHYHSNLPKREYAPYACIRNALIGYLYETLDSSSLAIQHYSKGCLIEQKRLMHCIIQQFLVHIDKLKLLVNSEPSSPAVGGGGVYSTVYNGSGHGSSGLLNPMSALSNILATYKHHTDTATPPVVHFLDTLKQISPLVGMHAYRLVLELLYRDLVLQLESHLDKDSVHINKVRIADSYLLCCIHVY